VEDGIRIDDSDVVLVGLAVSWESRDAYYIALANTAAKGLYECQCNVLYSAVCCPIYTQNCSIEHL